MKWVNQYYSIPRYLFFNTFFLKISKMLEKIYYHNIITATNKKGEVGRTLSKNL